MMHGPPSDETETTFHLHWQPASGFPIQPFPEAVYDALVLAQSLFHVAASASPLPTPEGLNMAVAAFQAAMKLHWQSPPVYEPNDRDDLKKLHNRLELIEQELKVTREETSHALLTLSAKLDNIAKRFEAQAVRLDSTAQAIGEETRKCSTMFEGLSSGIESIDKEVKSLMVVVDAAELEATTDVENTRYPDLKYVMVSAAGTEVGTDRIHPSSRKEDDEPGPRVGILNVTDGSTSNEALKNTRSVGSVGETTQGAHEQKILWATSVQTPSTLNPVHKAQTSNNVPGGVSQELAEAQEVDEDETSMKRCSKCKERGDMEKKKEEQRRRKAEMKTMRAEKTAEKKAEEQRSEAEEQRSKAEATKAEEKASGVTIEESKEGIE